MDTRFSGKSSKKVLFGIMGIVLILTIVISLTVFNSSIFGAQNVDYQIQSDWGSGAVVNVSIENTKSSPMDDWSITWTFNGNEKISNIWGAESNQSGKTVNIVGTDWNKTIPANGKVNFGLFLTYNGSNSVPSDIVLNGKTENTVEPTVEPTLEPTAEPTAEPTVEPTAEPTVEPTQGPVSTPDKSDGLLAFPGAEGYGKNVTGGRGGKVYEVTNLNKSGSGSFGAALSAKGARTVVFKVSGTIEGNFKISNDNITIAGQTAPGDGICIKGSIDIGADNVIIRYIRVRANPLAGETDAIGGRFQKNIIFDHISASWSSDEVMSLYHNTNVTIQWCMISEACEKAGEGHRFGGIWGNEKGTYHHNLIANNDSRNIRWASGSKHNDFRNNVVYNWGYGGSYGGEAQQVGNAEWNFSTINLIANYYKSGPATSSKIRGQIVSPSKRSNDDKGSWYVSDNYVEGYPNVTSNNWSGVSGSNYIKMSAPWNAMPIKQETAQQAYKSVLEDVGCSKSRDSIDKRIVEEARTGKSNYGNNGLISVPSDVGGWPDLKGGTSAKDSDHDGMPDSWEIANGLNPNNASDGNKKDSIGYTMLENYLNSIDTF